MWRSRRKEETARLQQHLSLEPDVSHLPSRHGLSRSTSTTLGHHDDPRGMTPARSIDAVPLNVPLLFYHHEFSTSRIRCRGNRRMASSSRHALIRYCWRIARSFAYCTLHPPSVAGGGGCVTPVLLVAADGDKSRSYMDCSSIPTSYIL